jgi:hypothetical protein
VVVIFLEEEQMHHTNEPKNTPIVLIRKKGTEHHTLTSRAGLTDDCVFEKSIESSTWPMGYLDQYEDQYEDDKTIL